MGSGHGRPSRDASVHERHGLLCHCRCACLALQGGRTRRPQAALPIQKKPCDPRVGRLCPREGCLAAAALWVLQHQGLQVQSVDAVRHELIGGSSPSNCFPKKYSIGLDQELYDTPARTGRATNRNRLIRTFTPRASSPGSPKSAVNFEMETFRLYWPSMVAKVDVVRQLYRAIASSGRSFRELFPEGTQMSCEEFEMTLSSCGALDTLAVDYIMDNHVGMEPVDCDAVVRNLVSEHFVAYLARSGVSLRAFFHRLDKRSYGYIGFEAFEKACQWSGLHGLRQEDLNVMYRLLEGSGGHGIVYRDLFNAFVPYLLPEMVAPLRTIRSVVAITRHGARFPLKPFPNSSVWPAEKTFWDSYAGKLSPAGVAQHERLGRRFRRKYIEVEGLLDPQDPDSTNNIYAFTGKSDRTMMSAQSFLHGMFPDIAVSFELEHLNELELFHSDSSKQNAREQETPVRECSEDACKHQTLKMHVSSKEYTPIIHGYKTNQRYNEIKHAAIEAGHFRHWSKEQKYLDLLEKLWTITGFAKLDPRLPALDRLKALQSVVQQLAVERAHRHIVLSSSSGESLQAEEELLVRDVGDYICRLRYCGSNEDEQRELSRRAVGLLPREIIGRFHRTIAEEKVQRTSPTAQNSKKRLDGSGRSAVATDGNFTLISAHDNSLMALLAHMGFNDFDIPCFGAYLTFELHNSPELGWHVLVGYNPDPDKYSLDGFTEAAQQSSSRQPSFDKTSSKEFSQQSLNSFRAQAQYFKIPDGGRYGVSWASVESGSMSFADFEQNFIVDRGAFMNAADWEMDAAGGEMAINPVPSLRESQQSLDSAKMQTSDTITTSIDSARSLASN